MHKPRASGWPAYLYAFTIFISAFLLFQVQPIIAKMILPWFGGSSAVWSTCMLFFQMVLLLGYLYAHWLHEMRGTRQALVHSILLAVSLAVLPILPNPAWQPGLGSGGNPTLLILGLLTVTIGLPYFILSATSPLLQAWYSRRGGTVPYRLFALSNFASMLALLSYPVLIEPNLTVHAQSYIWSLSYAGFALACGITAWISRAPAVAIEKAIDSGQPPGWGTRALWMAFAACASTLLLAVTTFLTQDIAAIPFLWILPLSVYLLSFIVCFESPRIYHRGFWMPMLAGGLICFAYFLWPQSMRVHMGPVLTLLSLSLLVCCMVCHGELARMKPHPARLTGYYVTISVGGAFGGLFVGLAAPNLFNAYYEFPIGLAACGALAVLVVVRQGMPRVYGAAVVCALLIYLAVLGSITRSAVSGYRAVVRNFYGELRVLDVGNVNDDTEYAYRKLLHGRINHGIQILDPEYRRTPVAYFCSASGIGHAMQARHAGTPWRVGILGLGAGALAAYGQPGDVFRIYEINPLVLDLAQSEFTYLKDTPAHVEVALGDGRLTLEREEGAAFDLLVMDAFSGDSVPVHLITEEAFAIYFRHLKPGGMLAVNISNRYLDLQPVMERAARRFGKRALVFNYTPTDGDDFCSASGWVILLERGAKLPDALAAGVELKPRAKFRLWTDDFSNMFSILK